VAKMPKKPGKKSKFKASYVGPREGPTAFHARFTATFEKQAKLVANKYCKTMAQAIVAEARLVLNEQEYNWQPLKDYYRRWKITHGLDERVLIATGFYRDNITSWVSKGKVHFGIKPTKKYPDGGPSLWKIAQIHEFGTKTIPARPLWGPLIRKYSKSNKEYMAMFRGNVMEKVKKQLAKDVAKRNLST
jgi:hypothetical protein